MGHLAFWFGAFLPGAITGWCLCWALEDRRFRKAIERVIAEIDKRAHG